ncbi:U-box domain-containing protein 28-like [Malania oleifera]|uniref:U-box domain-containing protein 28-like n=1 Tax=Malania oleifera TaxID=397392 RepID=UPI0025ADE3A0|nr:U-box domain-containing protein 28-like [Malania oleifera]
MARKDLFIGVPSFFRCPISLDVMKSPVSLSTGVTYDRSSIQTWLDAGHNTCPATMQPLPSTEFVPNHTLHRLINLWSQSFSPRLHSASAASSSLSPEQISVLIGRLETDENGTCLDSLSKIVTFAKASDENRRRLAKTDNFVVAMVHILDNASDDVQVLESIVKVLDSTVSERGVKEQLHSLIFKTNNNEVRLSSITLLLRKGSSESKIETVRVLEAIASDAESKRVITEQEGLLYELFHLLSSGSDPSSTEAALSFLIAVSTSRPVKTELVRLGIVQTVAKILSDSKTNAQIAEKALKLMEMVAKCEEGRKMICGDPICVAAVVQRIMRGSSGGTEHAIAVVWSVCYLFRDRTAQGAVIKNNGLTKILILMQSNCSPMVRQMCNDLVKIFKGNSKLIFARYDTRTTHIVPC